MSAILIADIDVFDLDTYSKYQQANPDVVNKFGGRYLALGGETKVLEGNWQLHRTIVIEFPSMEKLKAFYDSDEYIALRELRQQSAESNLIAIETLDKSRQRP